MNTAISIASAALLFSVLHGAPARAEIYQKKSPDGSLKFFNTPEPGRSAVTRLPESRFDGLIERISRSHGIDPYLIKCIVKAESDFNPDAVSESGAMGLMQLMMPTARYYGVRDPLDPGENLRAGIGHFRSLMVHFDNDIPLALAAYHAGMGIVKKKDGGPPHRCHGALREQGHGPLSGRRGLPGQGKNLVSEDRRRGHHTFLRKMTGPGIFILTHGEKSAYN